MADPRFFHRNGPFDLQRLADIAGGKLADGVDPNRQIEDVATLADAGPNQISFLDNKKYADDFMRTKAGACIVTADAAMKSPSGMALIISANPYKSYAKIAAAFYPPAVPTEFRHERAVIDPSAKMGASCHIGAGVVIGKNAIIGDHCIIEENVVIKDGVTIGNQTVIMSNATLSHCVIGNRVVIYPGARIGQPGFGFAPDPVAPVKVPQLGRVIVEDDVEIGANSTIDRGAIHDTVIGPGTMIDNLVQIGHNVKTGRGCVIVSQVGIFGSTILEDCVQLGGQAGVAGHLRLGRGARVAAKSGVMRDIAPGEAVGGIPAVPVRQWHKQTANLAGLSKPKKAVES